MPSLTTWMRLEPRSRDTEMNTSLQARIYDPLWLLARQWQFGEFQGEDNGSPVMARWRGESAPLTRFYPGAITPSTKIDAPSYDGSRMPLETLVEREAVRPSADQTSQPGKLRLAAEAGQHFLRMLNQQPLSADVLPVYRTAFIREYSFQALTTEQRALIDGDRLSFLDLMTARVPDGRRLYAAFHSAGSGEIAIAPVLNIAAGDQAEVEKAARLWSKWFETFFSEPDKSNPTWLAERMEYAFSVAAGFSDGERVLTSQEYFEGHLDWCDFDANLDQVTIGGAKDKAFKQITQTAIPAPVSFRGMPAPRFWEFEDAQVNFGSVDAGPTDLLRMLLVEFALAYGNDWFVIPIELEVGSLCQTRSLVITDTFGVRSLIKSSSELSEPFSTWRMFQHSFVRGSGLTRPAANLFFLPPSLVKSFEGQPIEEVLFLRDEMANMAWGVERVIESASERQLNRFEQERLVPPGAEKSAPEKLSYKLASEVPGYWVPLVPVKSNAGLRLQRGKLLRIDGPPQLISAQGRILNPDDPNQSGLGIFEEELPREGIRVTRSYQLTRWHDGSTHLWIGRRKRVGSGEGSSGLRFDRLEPGLP